VRFLDADTFTADRAWGALDITEIDGATVRLHWTDRPYVWHLNDGPEVFVVLSGTVDMHYAKAVRNGLSDSSPAASATPTPATSTSPTPRPRRGSS